MAATAFNIAGLVTASMPADCCEITPREHLMVIYNRRPGSPGNCAQPLPTLQHPCVADAFSINTPLSALWLLLTYHLSY